MKVLAWIRHQLSERLRKHERGNPLLFVVRSAIRAAGSPLAILSAAKYPNPKGEDSFSARRADWSLKNVVDPQGAVLGV